MSARETVLGAVRAALGQATLGRPRPDPAAVAAEARALLAEALPDEQRHGALARAGLPKTFRKAA